MQRCVETVLEMIRRGELRNVSSDGRVELDPDEVTERVDEMVGADQLPPYAKTVVRKIAIGEIEVPRPVSRSHRPIDLFHLVDEILALHSRALVSGGAYCASP